VLPEQVKVAHRGAAENPPNRFEKVHLERDEDWNPEEDPLPRTSPPAARLEAIRRLSQAGVYVGVLMAPIIPGLTDHEIPALLAAAAEAGAKFAGHVTLRLPHAVAPLFEKWLETHFPDRKEKVLNRLRAMRGGKLYDSEFGQRMRGEGIFADQIDQLFDVARRKAGIPQRSSELSVAAFRRPGGAQLQLFE
jgi:DNA repair photolyase